MTLSPRVPRARLTLAIVVAEGAAVADEVGFAQLTLAAVAQRAGVAAPSLYKHVRGLDHLQGLLAAQALHELTDAVSRATVGRSRGDALRALADAHWRYAHQHPGRYAAMSRAPSAGEPELGPAAADLRAVIHAVLDGYGISGGDVVDAIRLLRAFLHGYVALHAAGAFGTSRDVRRGFDRSVDALDMMLASWAASGVDQPPPQP